MSGMTETNTSRVFTAPSFLLKNYLSPLTSPQFHTVYILHICINRQELIMVLHLSCPTCSIYFYVEVVHRVHYTLDSQYNELDTNTYTETFPLTEGWPLNSYTQI